MRACSREILIGGDDDVRVPQHHLLDRDIGQPAFALAGDVARQKLDGLDIDRAAKPGGEPARPRA